MYLKLLVFLSFMLTTVCFSSPLQIDPESDNYDLLAHSEIFIDEDNSKTIRDLLKDQTLFKKSDTSFLHLGYTEKGVWIKFTLLNPHTEAQEYILRLSSQVISHADLYIESETGLEKKENGVYYLRNHNIDSLKIHFPLTFRPHMEYTCYLHLKATTSALYSDLKLVKPETFHRSEIRYQIILGLFFGALATLILYNLIIFLFTREIAYIYYVFYMLFTTVNYLFYTEMVMYILPDEWKNIKHFTQFLISGTSIFALLFIHNFLDIHRYQVFNKVTNSIAITGILFVIVTEQRYFPLDILIITTLLTTTYILYALHHNIENAKFLVIGWTFALLGWIALALYNYGLWDILNSYPYLYELCMFTEATLFAVALANKLNKNKELERSLQSNAILTQELHHRVKNNMQFIVSMYRLKLSKHINSQLSQGLREIEDTIRAMSATHEMLYNQNDVARLDTRDYFTTLLERVRHSYPREEINITLDINTTLGMNHSLHVGIILNELITNALKYAFDEKGGEITISLTHNRNACYLTVSDNGRGYDKEKTSGGFGHTLIQVLVYDELRGDMDIDTTNGTTVYIWWSCTKESQSQQPLPAGK